MNILCVWHGFVQNLNHFYVGFSFCWSNCRSWFSLEQNCRFIEDKLSSTTVEVQSSGWKLVFNESTVLFPEKINFYKLIILQNGYCWCTCFINLSLKTNIFLQNTSFLFTNAYFFETQYVFRKHLLFWQGFNKNPYFLSRFWKTHCFLLYLGNKSTHIFIVFTSRPLDFSYWLSWK